MKKVFSFAVQTLSLCLLLTPALAKADFDYSPVKALFPTPQQIGDCTVEWKDSTDPNSGGSGWIRVLTEERGVVSVFASKDQSVHPQTYSAYNPGKKTYYRLNGLPHEAKSGLSMNDKIIRIDNFIWEGVMFAGLALDRAEIRLDANGKPIEVTVGHYLGMYMPLPGGNSYTDLHSAQDNKPITCRAR